MHLDYHLQDFSSLPAAPLKMELVSSPSMHPPHPSQDVSKPEPLRLRRNLSAIINFCKFRDEKVYAFDELNQRLAAMSQEAEAAEEQRAKNVSASKGDSRTAREGRQPRRGAGREGGGNDTQILCRVRGAPCSL